MSVTLILPLGIICSNLLWLLCSYIITNFTLSVLHPEFSCPIYLFHDNRIYFSIKTDKCQRGDSLSEFKYKTGLSALAAQFNSTEILIVILIARSSTQYRLCTTWCSQQRKSELHLLLNFSGKNLVQIQLWSRRNGRCRRNWLFLRKRTLHWIRYLHQSPKMLNFP